MDSTHAVPGRGRPRLVIAGALLVLGVGLLALLARRPAEWVPGTPAEARFAERAKAVAWVMWDNPIERIVAPRLVLTRLTPAARHGDCRLSGDPYEAEFGALALGALPIARIVVACDGSSEVNRSWQDDR